MDIDDDIVTLPDDRGALDLSNRSWVKLDPTVWTMGRLLLELNVSYNKIISLPAEIGNLEILRVFNFSYNRIVDLPPEIGKLKRLREMCGNSNCIKEIPLELSRLTVLEDLRMSDNMIDNLPTSMVDLISIRILHFAGSRLKDIPIELPLLPTVEEVDFSNNPTLEMIPLEWQGSTKSIKSLCALHKSYQDRIADLMRASTDSVFHLEQVEHDQLVMEEKIAALTYEVQQLGRFVLKGTRNRITGAAKIHASRGSVKEKDIAKKNFPSLDDPQLYDDDDDDNIINENVGRRILDACCTVS